MAQYRLVYNKTTKVALVQLPATAVPAGSADCGTFEHADVEASINDLEFDTNHVLFQHVRDLLYKRSAANPAVTAKFPNNITDMASIKIQLGAGVTFKPVRETEGAEG